MSIMKKSLSVFLALIILAASAPLAFAEVSPDPSGLPEVRITLSEGLTLETINNGSKETKYPGNTVTLIAADGTEDTAEDVELKGRGNYTWSNPLMLKKPYQIKFPSKKNVFGMGKAKKWILLANQCDGTLMRNKLAFDLAEALGMPYTPKSMWVDVFVDSEYIGNYLLCEKNEIGRTRVDLKDNKGILCEMDRSVDPTKPYFRTAIDSTIVTLSDSVADDLENENSVTAAAFESVRQKLNLMEALLYDDNASWDQIAALIDVDSFINYYYIQELTEDPDGCRASFYLYVDGDDDVIHLGPVWDYDSAMGAYTHESFGGNTQVDYSINIQDYMGKSSVNWFRRLFMHSEFCALAADAYETRVKPVFDTIPTLIAGYLADEAFMTSVAKNYQRWDNVLGNPSKFGGNGHDYAPTYEEEVMYLSQWLAERKTYLDGRRISADEFKPPSQPEEPSTDPEPDPEPQPVGCHWCGKTHSNSFLQMIVGFFHTVFAKVFGNRY